MHMSTVYSSSVCFSSGHQRDRLSLKRTRRNHLFADTFVLFIQCIQQLDSHHFFITNISKNWTFCQANARHLKLSTVLGWTIVGMSNWVICFWRLNSMIYHMILVGSSDYYRSPWFPWQCSHRHCHRTKHVPAQFLVGNARRAAEATELISSLSRYWTKWLVDLFSHRLLLFFQINNGLSATFQLRRSTFGGSTFSSLLKSPSTMVASASCRGLSPPKSSISRSSSGQKFFSSGKIKWLNLVLRSKLWQHDDVETKAFPSLIEFWGCDIKINNTHTIGYFPWSSARSQKLIKRITCGRVTWSSMQYYGSSIFFGST